MEPLMNSDDLAEIWEHRKPRSVREKLLNALATTCVIGFFFGVPWSMVVWMAGEILRPNGLSFIWTSIIISVASSPVLGVIAFVLVGWPRWFPRKTPNSSGGFSGLGILDIIMPQIIGTIIYYGVLRAILAFIKTPDIEGWLDAFAGGRADAQATLLLAAYHYMFMTIALCIFWDSLWTKHYGDPRTEAVPVDEVI